MGSLFDMFWNRPAVRLDTRGGALIVGGVRISEDMSPREAEELTLRNSQSFVIQWMENPIIKLVIEDCELYLVYRKESLLRIIIKFLSSDAVKPSEQNSETSMHDSYNLYKKHLEDLGGKELYYWGRVAHVWGADETKNTIQIDFTAASNRVDE